jgi:SSS family solute:Na+ symporter
MIYLHALDYTAIAGYFLLTILIAAWVTRAKPDSDDLFLAGRSLGSVAVGFSLFSANVSSDTLIGLPGAAYAGGISVANYEWMAGVVLIFTVFFVTPVLMRARVSTLPEMMERRFDARMRRYLSAMTLFLSIILDTAATLYAGALVMTTFVPGLGLWETCAGIALFTGLYAAGGGLRAVVYTEVLQAVVLLLGSAVLATIVFGKFGYSWSAVAAAARPGDLSLVRPLDDATLPWLGLVTGVPIVGFYYWTMNQYVVQRILAARDVEAAARGALIASTLKLLPLFLMVLPGVMAVSLLPPLAHPDQVFPTLVAEFVPAGLRGLILAGLIAALMSTVSSTLNSSATLITLDFIQPRRPDLDSRQLARVGRVLTLAITAVAAAWAPMIQHFHGLWSYLQQVFAFVASPLVAVFLLGLWVRSLGPRAALRGLACGHVLSALLFALRQAGWMPIHFTVIGGVLFAATVAMTLLWKHALEVSDPPRAAALALVDPAGVRHASPLTRGMAIGVLLLIAILLAAFW